MKMLSTTLAYCDKDELLDPLRESHHHVLRQNTKTVAHMNALSQKPFQSRKQVPMYRTLAPALSTVATDTTLSVSPLHSTSQT